MRKQVIFIALIVLALAGTSKVNAQAFYPGYGYGYGGGYGYGMPGPYGYGAPVPYGYGYGGPPVVVAPPRVYVNPFPPVVMGWGGYYRPYYGGGWGWGGGWGHHRGWR